MTHDFDRDYWDQHWGAEGVGMERNPPNPHLIREVGGLRPGTALDAGCGAGAEAIWLARQGWQVTAADIAADALARAARRADGVTVQWVEADLTVWEPGSLFDLVTTNYAHPSMPQLAFYDRIATWVAPGGALLIVGHLHTAGTGHGHSGECGQEPPAEASVTVADITARLDSTSWTIDTAEESVRTMNGPGGQMVSLNDVVVRATRRP
jgi:SAM-dependent methyltransferase